MWPSCVFPCRKYLACKLNELRAALAALLAPLDAFPHAAALAAAAPASTTARALMPWDFATAEDTAAAAAQGPDAPAGARSAVSHQEGGDVAAGGGSSPALEPWRLAALPPGGHAGDPAPTAAAAGGGRGAGSRQQQQQVVVDRLPEGLTGICDQLGFTAALVLHCRAGCHVVGSGSGAAAEAGSCTMEALVAEVEAKTAVLVRVARQGHLDGAGAARGEGEGAASAAGGGGGGGMLGGVLGAAVRGVGMLVTAVSARLAAAPAAAGADEPGVP